VEVVGTLAADFGGGDKAGSCGESPKASCRGLRAGDGSESEGDKLAGDGLRLEGNA
jgi:hypothetical protein